MCFLFLVAVPDSLLALLIVFGWLMYICLVCLGIGRQIKVLNEGERAPEASLEESEKNTKKAANKKMALPGSRPMGGLGKPTYPGTHTTHSSPLYKSREGNHYKAIS